MCKCVDANFHFSQNNDATLRRHGVMTRSHRKSRLVPFRAENIFRKSHRRNFGCWSKCLIKTMTPLWDVMASWREVIGSQDLYHSVQKTYSGKVTEGILAAGRNVWVMCKNVLGGGVILPAPIGRGRVKKLLWFLYDDGSKCLTLTGLKINNFICHWIIIWNDLKNKTFEVISEHYCHYYSVSVRQEIHLQLRQWQAKSDRLWSTAVKLLPIPLRIQGGVTKPTPALAIANYATKEVCSPLHSAHPLARCVPDNYLFYFAYFTT